MKMYKKVISIFSLSLFIGAAGLHTASVPAEARTVTLRNTKTSVKVAKTASSKISRAITLPTYQMVRSVNTSRKSVTRWLEVCRTMAKKIYKNGFRYSYGAPSRSYQIALKGDKKSNCAMYCSWCLQEFGVTEYGQTYYVKSGGKIKKNFEWDTTKVDIIKVYKKVADYNLKPGDIVCLTGSNHTCIYAGRNEKGERLWYDAGRKYAKGKKNGAKYKELGAKPWNYYDKRTIGYLIRIKGLKY